MSSRVSTSVCVLILCLIEKCCCTVMFSVRASHFELFYGDSLNITINIATTEHMDSISLQLFLPTDLEFIATLHSSTCNEKKLCTPKEAVDFTPQNLTFIGPLIFDNAFYGNSSLLKIIPRTDDRWVPGYSHDAFIQFRNVHASQIHLKEVVVAILKYWNKTSAPATSQDEAATQKLTSKTFKLYPVEVIDLVLRETFDGEYPEHGTTGKVYLNSAPRMVAKIKVDRRGLPVSLIVTLPHFKEDCQMSCNSFMTAESSQMFVLDSDGNKRPLPLSVTKNSSTTHQVHFHIDSLTLSPSECRSNQCILELHVLTLIDQENAYTGQVLRITAEAFYGNDQSYSAGDETFDLTITGPDLSIQINMNPDEDIEAGDTIKAVATIEHTQFSNEDARIVGIQSILDQTQIKLNNETDIDFFGILEYNKKMQIKFNLTVLDGIKIGIPLNLTFKINFAPVIPHPSACLPGPCLHGGVCMRDVHGSKCLCPADYSAKDCSTRICSNGWSNLLVTDEVCYQRNTQAMNFSDAEAVCEKQAATLPVLNSDSEGFYMFFNTELSRDTLQTWIGLSGLGPKGDQWTWANGQMANIMDWAEDEPAMNSSCVVTSAMPGDYDRWRSRHCSDQLIFVCGKRGINGIGEVFQREKLLTVPTKPLVFDKALIRLENPLRIHEPATIDLKIELPFGTLEDAGSMISFESTVLSSIPIMIVKQNFEHSPNLQISSNLGNRRKRETQNSTHLQFNAAIGTVLNSAKNSIGSNLKLLSIFISPGDSESVPESTFQMGSYFYANGVQYPLASIKSKFGRPSLRVIRSIQKNPNRAGQSIVVADISHEQNSTAAAYDLTYMDDVSQMSLYDIPLQGVVQDSGRTFSVSKPMLRVGETMKVQYSFSPNEDMGEGNSDRKFSVNFNSILESEAYNETYSGEKRFLNISYCLYRGKDVVTAQLSHNHGFSFLGFLIALLVGFIVTILFLKYHKSKKHRVGSADAEALLLRESPEDMRLLDGGIEDSKLISQTTSSSILPILKQSHQQARNVINTQNLNEATNQDKMFRHNKLEALHLLLDENVEKYKDEIGQQNFQKLTKLNATKEKEMIKVIENEMKKKTSVAVLDINEKYEKEYGKMRARHSKERLGIAVQATAGSKDTMEQIEALLKESHESDLQALKHSLQMDLEKSRLELEAEKHAKHEVAILQSKLGAIDESIKLGNIEEFKGKELKLEVANVFGRIGELFDQRKSSEREYLNHRFELRHGLIDIQKFMTEQEEKLFAKLEHAENEMVALLGDNNNVSTEDYHQMKIEFALNLKNTKRLLTEKRRFAGTHEHEETHMDQIKRVESKHVLQKEELRKKHPGKVSITYLEALEELEINQMKELTGLKNTLDQKGSKMIMEMRNEVKIGVKQDYLTALEQIMAKFKIDATESSDVIKTLGSVWDDFLNEDSQKLDEFANKTDAEFETLTKSLDMNAEDSCLDLKSFREQERKFLSHLVTETSAIDENEMNYLLENQAKSLAKVERGLAIERIQQMIYLKEKLETRKQKTFAKFQKKETKLIKSDASSSTSDEEKLMRLRELTLTKLKTLCEFKSSASEDISQIRQNMLKDRAAALRNQEDYIGGLIIKLQMSKAKQLAELNMQDRCLRNLTDTMTEDLREKGVLHDPDCRRILQEHNQQQLALKTLWDSQKIKQEETLRSSLELRSRQRIARLQGDQEEKLKQVLENNYDTQVHKSISGMKVIEDQCRETMQIREDTERDEDLIIEDQRAEFEIMKQKALQEQETELAKNLTVLGEFQEDEVGAVLKLLMPHKSTSELETLVQQIHNISPDKKDRAGSSTLLKHAKRLAEKREKQWVPKKQRQIEAFRPTTSSWTGRPKTTTSRPRTSLPPIAGGSRNKMSASVQEITEYLPPKRSSPSSRSNSSNKISHT